jgi:hypothetical protein
MSKTKGAAKAPLPTLDVMSYKALVLGTIMSDQSYWPSFGRKPSQLGIIGRSGVKSKSLASSYVSMNPRPSVFLKMSTHARLRSIESARILLAAQEGGAKMVDLARHQVWKDTQSNDRYMVVKKVSEDGSSAWCATLYLDDHPREIGTPSVYYKSTVNARYALVDPLTKDGADVVLDVAGVFIGLSIDLHAKKRKAAEFAFALATTVPGVGREQMKFKAANARARVVAAERKRLAPIIKEHAEAADEYRSSGTGGYQ